MDVKQTQMKMCNMFVQLLYEKHGKFLLEATQALWL